MAGPGHTSHPPQSFNINSAVLANIKVYYVTHIEAIMSQSYSEARFYKKKNQNLILTSDMRLYLQPAI